MAHPNGGSGGRFEPTHSFKQIHAFIGKGFSFESTTRERVTATQGYAKGGKTPTIVFKGERTRHGSVCQACWGFRIDCNGSRIGQCAEALDRVVFSNTDSGHNGIARPRPEIEKDFRSAVRELEAAMRKAVGVSGTNRATLGQVIGEYCKQNRLREVTCSQASFVNKVRNALNHPNLEDVSDAQLACAVACARALLEALKGT